MIAFELVEFAFEVSTIPLSLAMPIVLQRALLRRMDVDRRWQAWPEGEQLSRTYLASCAPLGAILSMVPFCVVTRKHQGPLPMALAILQGIGWSMLLVGALILYGVAYRLVLELTDPRLVPALMGS